MTARLVAQFAVSPSIRPHNDAQECAKIKTDAMDGSAA